MKEKTKEIKIWCTLGPSSLNKRVIERLEDIGISMFRINLSHTNIEDIEKTILEVKKYTTVPVCLDTEGPQIRSGVMKDYKVFLKANSFVKIRREEILGDCSEFNLFPGDVISKFKVGDLISIDFDSALLSVYDIKDTFVEAKVICEGWVGSRKAVTIDRKIDLPTLSKKDRVGIDIIKKHDLRHISLSFVNAREDVELARKLIGPSIEIISKIETNAAVVNLEEIISCSDAILIDRGDLSREEPINKIPLLQKEIIKRANEYKKQVLVATNFLESMVTTKKPLRSEVNDIMTTLLDGASGLVLAAETAIGKYPVECGNMVKRMIKYFEIAQNGYSLPQLLKNDSFLLIEPHGGELIQRFDERADIKKIERLSRLIIDELVMLDAEQIAIGAYSPLKGFMTKDELSSVLDNYKLPNGVIWTLPIILQIPREDQQKLKKNTDIALVYEKDGLTYGYLQVKDVFKINLERVAKKWFGTKDHDHPGVKRLFEKGEYCLGGEITLIRKRDTDFKEFAFTPQQMRIIFEHKEWSKVAGFHTRNAIHRAHEYLQIKTLEKYNFDGLFLHPIVGPKKSFDYLPHIILESYKIMLEHYYPKDKFVFGVFSGYSHYAGPREAIFTALCRKNFGCSHFIVGRDHTGVKDYYKSEDTKKLFDQLGDIGIKPIFFDTVYYCNQCKSYVESCQHSKEDHLHISGTEARNMFLSGAQPPEWFLRDKISTMISERIKKGEEVFVR